MVRDGQTLVQLLLDMVISTIDIKGKQSTYLKQIQHHFITSQD